MMGNNLSSRDSPTPVGPSGKSPTGLGDKPPAEKGRAEADSSALSSAGSSVVSIPDLAHARLAPDVGNPRGKPAFVDKERGKPLFKRHGPPSSTGSLQDQEETEQYKFKQDEELDQLSITNEDYL